MLSIALIIGWLLGIGLAGWLAWPSWVLGVGGVVLGGTAVALREHQRELAFLLAVLASTAVGMWRFQVGRVDITPSHVAFYNDSREVTLTGIVIDEPDVRDRAVNLRVAVEEMTTSGGEVRAVSGLVLVQGPRFPVYEYGTRVMVRGRLQTPPENPEFSYRDFLARQGVYSMVTWPRITAVEERVGSPFYHAIYDWKGRAQATIDRLVPAPESGLLSGILLGVAHAMPPEIDADFRTTGITHIVVISGFNIAIIAAVLVRLADPLVGERGSALLAMGGIAVYTLLVGADPSVVRAAIMGSVYVLGERWLGRPNAALGSLFFAAFVMTLYNPLSLWDVGFQLSFVATLSLMLYANALVDWARGKLLGLVSRRMAERVLGVLSDAVLITVAAQILTLPLLMYYFQRVSLISLVANAFILPAQPPIMIVGGLAVIVGLVLPSLGQVVMWLVYLFLWYTIRMAQVFAQVPFAEVDVWFPWWALVGVYGATAVWTWYAQQEPEVQAVWRARVRWQGAAGAWLMGIFGTAVLSALWTSSLPDGHLRVAFLDVGQGDAIFVQTPSGRQILIDGGHYPTILEQQLGRQMPLGDRSLDMLIATHADADHVSGLPELFNRYEISQLLVPDEASDGAIYDALLGRAKQAETPIWVAQAGEVVEIGDGVRLEVVHPAQPLASDDRNNNSLSVRLVYGSFTLLLTGDVEETGEREMLGRGLPLQSLVFKAGHHGAKNGSNAFFLDVVQPQIIVVSAGEGNRFGHPHPEMLARAAAIGATVLRTDELGTIEVITDGERMWWQARP